MPVGARRLHIRAPRPWQPWTSFRLQSVSGETPNSVQSRLQAWLVGVLIPRMRLVSRKGNFQLHKQTPRRIVNMEAIQTCKEGISGLEMVISRDPAASCRAPYREVQLALPPVHRSVLPAAPRLVSHINVSSERGVLTVGEDVREFHLEAVPFVIHHNLLAGQRERLLLFEMSPRLIFYGAFERVSRHPSLCTSHSPTFKMGNRSLFPALRVGAGSRSLLPPLAQYQRRVREWRL